MMTTPTPRHAQANRPLKLKTKGTSSLHRKPTMADVARLAGVGAMTVSRVLSGTVPVAEETARRVQRAVEQLAYRPNQLAQAFRGQRSRTIGLIIPYLYDHFFANCAHAVTTVAKEHQYSVITTTSNEDPEIEYAEAEQMLQRHVEGLIVIPSRFRQSRLNRSLFGRTPVVAFDRPVSDPSVDAVLVENTSGSRRMVQHLIEHGYKNISFMGMSRNLYTMNARYLGYHRAMHEAGLQESVFFGCSSRDDTRRAVEELLNGKNRPEAFFASNNLATRYVFAALLHLGVKVPGDVALAGFDDFELAELTSPPLTVVRQPSQEMGRVAASLLFERIERGELPQTGTRIALPVEIVVRRSCGCKHRTAVLTN
jgi:LacI family transcriptional regulator